MGSSGGPDTEQLSARREQEVEIHFRVLLRAAQKRRTSDCRMQGARW